MDSNSVVIFVSVAKISEVNGLSNAFALFVTVLYYKGPKYYHASYVVIVNDSQNNVNVLDMQSNYRVAETANKDVIITNVMRPNGLTYVEPYDCIEQLAHFTIDEFLPKRFQPHQGANDMPSTSGSWKKIKMTDAPTKL